MNKIRISGVVSYCTNDMIEGVLRNDNLYYKDRQENNHLLRIDNVFYVWRKDVDKVQKFLFFFDQLQQGSCSFSAVSGRSWFDFEIRLTGENQAKKK